MQISTEVSRISSWFSVGLATIGVCVFCAVYFGSRTFYLGANFQFSGGIMKPNYVAKKSVMSVISFWSILLCILIIPIFILIFRIIATKKYRIEFYDDKIVVYSGLININKKQIVFMGVTATSVHQTLFGQIFKYGDLIIDCVGKWDLDTTYIKNPRELEAYLQDKIIPTQQSNQFVHI